jgi:tRNA G18 (ribose-2'-O)-methylase SpoU
VQGTEAPQGVVAFAEPLTAASLDELVLGWNEASESARSDAGTDSEMEIEDDDDDDDDAGFFIDLDDDVDSDDDEFPVLVEFVDVTDDDDGGGGGGGDDDDDDEGRAAVVVSEHDTIDDHDEEMAGAEFATDEAIAAVLIVDDDAGESADFDEGVEPDRIDADVPLTTVAVKEALQAAATATGRGDNVFLVLLEGVTDPQNLGAILRSAECAGVSGVAVPRHRSVHVTPAVTKAAAGAIEYLQMALVAGMPSALQDLERLGVMTVGLDERGTTSLYDLDLGDRPVALVLGSEGSGLSPLSRRRCEVLCRIPVGGEIPSLNVAAAAAAACFEVARQRNARKGR